MDKVIFQTQKRAVELALQGELEAAEFLFLQALELDGGDIGYAGLGWFYGLARKDREAVRCFRRGLSGDPESGDLCNEVGVFLLRRGRTQSAVRWLNRAVRAARCRNRHLAFYNLALAFRRMNRPERSRRYLHLALKTRPGFAEAAEFLSELDPVL